MDEDRDAATAFFELRPLLFDGTQRTGDQAIHRGPWVDFRARIIARYGPPPDEGANAPVAPEWRAMHILRKGLPPEVKYFVLAPVVRVSLEDMIDAIMDAEIIAHMVQIADPEDVYHVDPVDDAGISEPLFEGVPTVPEDPIPVVPLQEIPPHKAEAGLEDDMDPDDDPLVILIESDDEEQEIWEEEWVEFEDIEDEEIEDLEEQEEDPEEIPFDDEDRDVFSDATTE
ncbi:hypothetical protein TIFTF001_041343 [Ficus carica]|uniref:Uncharacterized protein n=1 Tax=Ficus carica TaxID=3494 RepID=A0AA87ZNA4_FICCA|nr:hypothetical protein TIFTF001_041343 [Ficus carica]